MDSFVQITNGPAKLIHSISLVTFCGEPLLVSFEFAGQTITIEITFSDDGKVGGANSVATVGSRKISNETEIGTLNFHNMLRAGEITPLDAFHVCSFSNKELFVTCDIKDPHKGRYPSLKYDHKTVIMSFWSINADRNDADNHV